LMCKVCGNQDCGTGEIYARENLIKGLKEVEAREKAKHL